MHMGGDMEELAKANPLIEGYRSLDTDPAKAGELARRALRMHPNSPPALRLVGLVARSGGQFDEAAEFEQRAVRAAAGDASLLRAGHALFANELHEAEPLLKERLKRDPHDYSAMRMLAELAARIGRLHDSENLLRRALEL